VLQDLVSSAKLCLPARTTDANLGSAMHSGSKQSSPPAYDTYEYLLVNHEDSDLADSGDDLLNSQPQQHESPVLVPQGAKHYVKKNIPKDLTWRDAATSILQSNTYQCLMSAAILGNALVMGFETDMPENDIWGTLENCFLVLFTAELIIRMVVYGVSEFFDIHSRDFVWNCLDFLVVFVGLLGSAFSAASAESPTGGLAIVFRVVRLQRILRIIRLVRFMRQLYLLAFGFVEAAKAVMWVSILMVFVLYVCAVLLVETVGQQADEPDAQIILQSFGNIPRTMLTLFEVMASPTISPFEGIMYDYPLVAVFLVIFVIFGSFGMIALLTGVIQESMFQKNQMRQAEERKEHSQQRQELDKQSELLFTEIKNAETGEASIEAVRELIADIEDMFNDLGIEYDHKILEKFAGLIDTDGSGTISQQEFHHGIMALAHGTQSMSTVELYYHLHVLKTKQAKVEVLLRRSNQQALKTMRSTEAALSNRIDQVGMSLQSVVNEQKELSRQNKEILRLLGSLGTSRAR